MVVIGPYIPVNTIVSATSNESSITKITLLDVTGNAVTPTESNAGTTLEFKNTNDLVKWLNKEKAKYLGIDDR